MATLESVLEQFGNNGASSDNSDSSVTIQQIEECTELQQLLDIKSKIDENHRDGLISFDRMVSLANHVNKKVVRLHKGQPAYFVKVDSYKGIEMVEVGGTAFTNGKGEATSKKVSLRFLQFILDNAEALKEQM